VKVNIKGAEADRLLKLFPDITDDQDDKLDRLFEPYLFYETRRERGERIRECVCTACRSHFDEPELKPIMGIREREFWGAKHNGNATCPNCGYPVTLKCVGKCKNFTKLWKSVRVVLLMNTPEGLFVRAAYAIKDYSHSLLPKVALSEKARYYFAPGKVGMWMWQYDWTGIGISPSGKELREGWATRTTCFEPFPAFAGMGYNLTEPDTYIIGAEALRASEMRYCGYEALNGRLVDSEPAPRLMTYLGEYAMRPTLEMAARLGLQEVVDDLIYRKKTNRQAINWKAKKPYGLLKLTKTELRDFMAAGGDLCELLMWTEVKKTETAKNLKQVMALRKLATPECVKKMAELALSSGVTLEQMANYLTKQGFGLVHGAELLKDYHENAKRLGYDMKVRTVAMPKALADAHDAADAARVYMEDKKKAERYKKRRIKLTETYAFEDDTFAIIIPAGHADIVREGKALRHCVGGYADRHMEGKTTILFLRRKNAIKIPLATIEMNGKAIIQVRGYHNDIEEGAIPARKLYACILEPWLKWVKDGSKRDKDGRPRLPEIKEVSAA